MQAASRSRLERARDKLAKARKLEEEAWNEVIAAARAVREEDNESFQEIGKVLGVTRARVYQMVEKDTKPRPPPHPIPNKEPVSS